MAKTVNGTVTMTGPLAKSGWYGFTNMTGDIVLALPTDASFQLNAKVSEKHDIVSDFKLTYLNEPPPPPPAVRAAGLLHADAKTAAAKGQPAPKTGPVLSPIIVAKASRRTPYVLRRVNADLWVQATPRSR